jgi:MYXO-CTERM domain-containing protein
MRAAIVSRCVYGVAVALAIVAAEAVVGATVAPGVPEIDGSTLSAAMGLLAGGVLVLRSRRRSK